jgi:chromosome segregation ATPase
LAFKQDALLKQWMEREKAALAYGRACDKRIAELQAQISELEARLNGAPESGSTKTPLEQQLQATNRMARELSLEIEQLRAQLSHSDALHQEKTQDTQHRLTRLETVAEMAQTGLAEELRILKKGEPELQDSVLVSDGEDLIPSRWLPLKRALQALHGAGLRAAKHVRGVDHVR